MWWFLLSIIVLSRWSWRFLFFCMACGLYYDAFRVESSLVPCSRVIRRLIFAFVVRICHRTDFLITWFIWCRGWHMKLIVSFHDPCHFRFVLIWMYIHLLYENAWYLTRYEHVTYMLQVLSGADYLARFLANTLMNTRAFFKCQHVAKRQDLREQNKFLRCYAITCSRTRVLVILVQYLSRSQKR